MKKPVYKWKFLREGLKSEHGKTTWNIDKWKKHRGEVELCKSGFHCSDTIYQAFTYVQGEILAKVEVRGKSQSEDDKSVWSEMKIVKAYKWQKQDSIALAIYAAELVIDVFEKRYPGDKRPREAIEAAKRYLNNPTQKNRIACGEAADAAWVATWEAARAARAAEATWAVEVAAQAAKAAWVVEATARAAKAALVKKISIWMDERVNQLEEYGV